MPGYVGTLLDIHDPDRFRDYLKGVGPSLAKYGGRIALRRPIAGVVEGKLDTREDTRLGSRAIIEQVTSWPGVTAHDHRFGGIEFRLGNRQLGHLHGARTADIPLKRSLRDELIAAGRVRIHRWRPDSGWVTVDLDSDAGKNEAVRLLRIGYDNALRARERRGN